MTRAGVAELKANLSRYLRRVREGEIVTVTDRDTPVAKIVAIDSAETSGFRVRPARGTLAGLRSPRRLRTGADVIDLLLEERGER